MPIPSNPLGSALDPSLLAPPVQPSHAEPVPPVDPVQAAVMQALETLNAPSPTTVQHGQADLLEPEWSPRPLPVQNRPDFRLQAHQVPEGWPAVETQTGTPEVTITSQQRPLTKAGEAAVQRQYLLDDPSRPLKPGDVSGAQYREQQALDQAGQSTVATAVAEHQAQQGVLSREAEAHTRYVQEVEAAQQQYQAERQAMYAKHDAETAMWQQQLEAAASQEPNPGRWWDNQSGLSKALWGLSLVFSAANVAMSPGAQNVALNMIMNNVQQDVQEQKARLDRELGALKTKGATMEARHRRNLTDLTDDHTMTLGRLEALKLAALHRASITGDAGLQAAVQGAIAWIDQQKLATAKARTQQAIQIDEAQKQRAHAARLALIVDKRERELAAARLAAQYDLARLEQDGRAQAAQAAKFKDVQGVPTTLGAKMVGSPLGDQVQVHKEDAVKMRSLFHVANQRYDDLQVIHQAIKDGSLAQRLVDGDHVIRSAAARLRYSTAADFGQTGHSLSDKDVSMMASVDLGYDPAGGPLDVARFYQNADGIAKKIEEELKNLPNKVAQHASTYLDTNLVGTQARILWTPQSMKSPDLATPNAAELYDVGRQAPPVADKEDFLRRQTMESVDPMFRGSLPKYDQEAVAAYRTSLQGLGPEDIRRAAEKALRDYADPWGDKPPRGDAATTRFAIEAETDKALELAEKAARQLKSAAVNMGGGFAYTGKGRPTLQDVRDLALRGDIPLTDAREAILRALEAAQSAYDRNMEIRGRKGK